MPMHRDHSACPSAYLALIPRSAPAARSAARSSRVRVGDLVDLPFLMNAPCPHCNQIKIRGSCAVVAPTWPQFGY